MTVFQTVVGSPILPSRTNTWAIFYSRDTLTTSSKLSPATILFLRSKPHFSHLWIIDHSPPFSSACTGFITPPHPEARSPGSRSTCLLQRHLGQWLVYPLPSTSTPQFSQQKFSIFLINAMVCVLSPPVQMRSDPHRESDNGQILENVLPLKSWHPPRLPTHFRQQDKRQKCRYHMDRKEKDGDTFKLGQYKTHRN